MTTPGRSAQGADPRVQRVNGEEPDLFNEDLFEDALSGGA
jgi:hypothetical protein